MKLYCCGCQKDTIARLTNGNEIYQHRGDLYRLPFWKCDQCGNFVGCHHKTKTPTQPLGCIPTPEIREARKRIHKVLDPIWQSGSMDRKTLYADISSMVGWKYHTAKIRSVEEAERIYTTVVEYSSRLAKP